MQTVNSEYLHYWGLKKEPFHLAPDEEMMYLGGQYYECFERLLYAVNTNKGGALVVSEEAGLGKTTVLLKLIAEVKAEHEARSAKLEQAGKLIKEALSA